jgi:sugar lactone lactonase YvrE
MQSPPLLASRARKTIRLAAAATTIIMGILLAADNVTVANAQQQQQTTTTTSKIEKVWESPAQFKTPESVIYDPNGNMLFVSNIDGQPDGKDNQGFISKVSPLDGSIVELNWVTGLNAPKGMTIINNNNTNNTLLYVSDITDLVEVDINSGRVINRYIAPGSVFLNDVASDNQGYVYVSDTVTNTIYRLDTKNLGNNNNNTTINNNNNNNATLQVWLQSPELNGPNGLYVDNSNNKLIVASLGEFSNPSGTIRVVDLQNRTVTGLGNEGSAVPIGGLDGIEADSTGRYYYVTDNTGGKLYVVNSNGTGYETSDLQKQGAADLGIILDQNTIVIPMIQDNKLEAYRIMR